MAYQPVTWKSLQPSNNSGTFNAMLKSDALAAEGRQQMLDAVSGFKTDMQTSNEAAMAAELAQAGMDEAAYKATIDKYAGMGFAPGAEAMQQAQTQLLDNQDRVTQRAIQQGQLDLGIAKNALAANELKQRQAEFEAEASLREYRNKLLLGEDTPATSINTGEGTTLQSPTLLNVPEGTEAKVTDFSYTPGDNFSFTSIDTQAINHAQAMQQFPEFAGIGKAKMDTALRPVMQEMNNMATEVNISTADTAQQDLQQIENNLRSFNLPVAVQETLYAEAENSVKARQLAKETTTKQKKAQIQTNVRKQLPHATTVKGILTLGKIMQTQGGFSASDANAEIETKLSSFLVDSIREKFQGDRTNQQFRSDILGTTDTYNQINDYVDANVKDLDLRTKVKDHIASSLGVTKLQEQREADKAEQEETFTRNQKRHAEYEKTLAKRQGKYSLQKTKDMLKDDGDPATGTHKDVEMLQNALLNGNEYLIDNPSLFHKVLQTKAYMAVDEDSAGTGTDVVTDLEIGLFARGNDQIPDYKLDEYEREILTSLVSSETELTLGKVRELYAKARGLPVTHPDVQERKFRSDKLEDKILIMKALLKKPMNKAIDLDEKIRNLPRW